MGFYDIPLVNKLAVDIRYESMDEKRKGLTTVSKFTTMQELDQRLLCLDTRRTAGYFWVIGIGAMHAKHFIMTF